MHQDPQPSFISTTLPRALARAGFLTVLAIGTGGGGCPSPSGGGSTSLDTDTASGSTTEGSGELGSGGPGSAGSATTESDASGTTGSASGPDSGSDSGGAEECLPPGTFTVRLVSINDPFGHFAFLKLWFAPGDPAPVIDEIFTIDYSDDGTGTLTVEPRASGTGEGHGSIVGLSLVHAACRFTAEEQASNFSSDAGDWPNVMVQILDIDMRLDTAEPRIATMHMEGGGIPNGPIEYEIELLPE
jgi:hypothetical protein